MAALPRVSASRRARRPRRAAAVRHGRHDEGDVRGDHGLRGAARRAPLPAQDLPGRPRAARSYFVHCPALYARGRLYTSDADEHRRFLALSLRGAARSCQRLDFAPDIVHGHDWQAALLPMLAEDAASRGTALFAQTRTLLTIHNLMYQGSFPVDDRPRYRTSARSRTCSTRISCARGASTSCSRASSTPTASPRSARPTRARSRPQTHGAGLDGLLRARARRPSSASSTASTTTSGRPRRDRYIPHRYSADDLRRQGARQAGTC